MTGDVIQRIFAINVIWAVMLSQAMIIGSEWLRILDLIVFGKSVEGYITLPFITNSYDKPGGYKWL
jgi:hypothetical protein